MHDYFIFNVLKHYFSFEICDAKLFSFSMMLFCYQNFSKKERDTFVEQMNNEILCLRVSVNVMIKNDIYN